MYQFQQSSHTKANCAEAGGDSWKEMTSIMSSMRKNQQMLSTTKVMLECMNGMSSFTSAAGIFDIGCGTGSVMSSLLDTYGNGIPSTARLLAADFSESMVDKLREVKQDRVVQGKELWERLEIQQLDAHDISTLSDSSFSHVVGGHVYFLLTDPEQALRETYRVLRHGGVVASSNGKQSQHVDAINEAVETIRPGTNLRLLQGPWTSEAGVKGLLEAAGFTDVETILVPSTMPYESHIEFAKMLLSMPVMKSTIEDYSDSEGERLLDALIAELGKRNPAQPGELQGTSIVALARRE